jgi:hypothetical protein
MKWDVILELMDGRRQEATLARPFLPIEAVRDDLSRSVPPRNPQ